MAPEFNSFQLKAVNSVKIVIFIALCHKKFNQHDNLWLYDHKNCKKAKFTALKCTKVVKLPILISKFTTFLAFYGFKSYTFYSYYALFVAFYRFMAVNARIAVFKVVNIGKWI
jgi:hypothetical protein